MKRKTKSFDALLEDVGYGLGELRKKKGYDTIKDFAEDHKLPLIQYWRIERGKSNLTLKTLTRLLSIHKISLEDFFCYLKNN